jgi:hypothetical protein
VLDTTDLGIEQILVEFTRRRELDGFALDLSKAQA